MEPLGNMAIDQFEWVTATAEDQPEKPALIAGIRCMCQGREVARCHFFRDDIPLAPNWFDGRCFHLMYHWRDHPLISGIFSGRSAICLRDLLDFYAISGESGSDSQA
jgi:hypothetical protein